MSKRLIESTSNELAKKAALVISENGKKLKKGRSNYERKPIIKFKRYINGLEPESKQKKEKYSKDPDVIKRRRFCNAQRLTRAKILEILARNGQLFDKNGNVITVYGGCIVKKSLLKYNFRL